MAKRSRSHYLKIGVLGEDLVTQWLRSTGWAILERRWHCRWGEIDIVARSDAASLAHSPTPCLAFVEVKTRGSCNWDAGGLLSITAPKQAKLWQTARCFLATHPSMAEYQCRFDVALVCYRRLSLNERCQDAAASATVEMPIDVGQAVFLTEYQLILQNYIPSAFC